MQLPDLASEAGVVDAVEVVLWLLPEETLFVAGEEGCLTAGVAEASVGCAAGWRKEGGERREKRGEGGVSELVWGTIAGRLDCLDCLARHGLRNIPKTRSQRDRGPPSFSPVYLGPFLPDDMTV